VQINSTGPFSGGRRARRTRSMPSERGTWLAFSVQGHTGCRSRQREAAVYHDDAIASGIQINGCGVQERVWFIHLCSLMSSMLPVMRGSRGGTHSAWLRDPRSAGRNF